MLACAVLLPLRSLADDDSARIPTQALDDEAAPPAPPVPAAAAAAGVSAYAEAQAEAFARRPLVVPIGPTDPHPRIARALADVRAQAAVATGWSAGFSGRFTHEWITDTGLGGEDDRLDVREAFVSWRPTPRDSLAAGRVQERDGVAFGVNPTDYFKTRSVVDLSSRDPILLRENRLGTVMLQGQHLFDHGAIGLIFAPRLSDQASWRPPRDAADLQLSRTNGDTRWLLKASAELGPDIAPQAFVYHDAGGWQFGLDLTHSVGNQGTLYFEGSLAHRVDALATAIAIGTNSGDLPPATAAFDPAPAAARLYGDVALGGTWTTDAALTLTLEFDWHPAGYTDADWDRWFAVGTTSGGASSVAWALRGISAQLQDSITRNAVFARVQWDRAFVRDLTLSGFADVDLDTDSTQLQLAAEYRPTRGDRIRLSWLQNLGPSRSRYGSDPARHDVLLAWAHYF
jgi:hypothetical protein